MPTTGRLTCGALWAVLVGASALQAQDGPAAEDTLRTIGERTEAPFFYRGVRAGSDAYLGPLDVLLNKGYATLAFGDRSQEIFAYEYGTRAVNDALLHPFEAIRRSGGWGDFLTRQVLPLRADWRDWEWYPNYFGHVFEGGIVYRRLAEWFDARHVPHARLLAGVTTMAAAYVNETYEMSGATDGVATTVADLYLFDPLGIVLFSDDRVAHFFANRLGATVWPGQASVVAPSGELANSGNNLVFKLPVSPFEDTSLFFRTGVNGHVGLTFHRGDGLDVSVGVGADTKNQRRDPLTGQEDVDLLLSAAVFVDRDQSLLWSLYLSEVEHRVLTLNVYPGVIAGARVGGWVVIDHNGTPRIGITSRHTFGLGLGIGY